MCVLQNLLIFILYIFIIVEQFSHVTLHHPPLPIISLSHSWSISAQILTSEIMNDKIGRAQARSITGIRSKLRKECEGINENSY